VEQKNCDVELKLKQQREEEEQLEAAKNRKLVAKSSVKLTAILVEFSDAFFSRSNDGFDEKLSSFKQDILQHMEARKRAADARISSKLDEKFVDLLRAKGGKIALFNSLI
jgi:predicted RNA-binding protein with RPS1 domain